MPAAATPTTPLDRHPGRVVYNQRWRSGLPLGGLGCGKIELLTDGALGNFTGNHNWDQPTRVIPGAFFALDIDGTTTLLRLKRGGEYENVNNVTETTANFLLPRGHVRFGGLPIDVELEAFAPLIPGDIKNSSMPLAFFTFTLRSDAAHDVRLLFSWQNLVSFGGRKDVISDDHGWRRHEPLTIGSWSGLRFTADPATKLLNHWGNHLALIDGPTEIVPHWDPNAGMVARHIELRPGEPRRVRCLLSWVMPHHHVDFAKRRKQTDRLIPSDARLALDGDENTLWRTDSPTCPGEYLLLDFGTQRTIDRLVANNRWWQGDFTVGFVLERSLDGNEWLTVPARREQVRDGRAEFRFEPITARWWRIRQTHYFPDLMWAMRTVQAFLGDTEFKFVQATGHVHPEHYEITHEDLGHYYSNYFDDAASLAAYATQHVDDLYEKTAEWHQLILDADLPDWLKTLLTNHTFPAFSNSILTRDGRFSVAEAPVHMVGALGTMDQRQASHAFWTMMFPELDRRELELYALCQTRVEPVADGRIPHFCGNFYHAVGDPMVDYGSPDWPDLSCSWIMQVCKWHRWTGDDAFLHRMWPHVKAALAWLAAADTDGDLIPEGGSTYDYEHLPRGAYVFTASVYLGALRAGSAMARHLGEPDPYADHFNHVQASTIERLFDRDQNTLIKWRGGDQVRNNTFVAALAGDWLVRLMGLEPIFPPDVTSATLRALLARHLKSFAPIPPMEVTPDGQVFTKICFVLQHQPYLGCEAIYNGYVEEGLEVHRRIYEAAWEVNWSPWDCSLNLEAPHGKQSWLLSYMTCTATWHILPALAGMTVNIPAGELRFHPPAPYRGPVFFPNFWLWLECTDGRATARVIKVLTPTRLTHVNGQEMQLDLRPGATWDLSSFAKFPTPPQPVEPAFPNAQPTRTPRPWTLTSSNAVDHDAPPTQTQWAIDGDPATCWWTNDEMRPGDWLAVDFGKPEPLRAVTCDHSVVPREYPRGLRLDVSDDGRNWRPLTALSLGEVQAALAKSPVLTIPCETTTQHVRLVNQGRARDARWSITHLDIVT